MATMTTTAKTYPRNQDADLERRIESLTASALPYYTWYQGMGNLQIME
jgi:hypothetical protein